MKITEIRVSFGRTFVPPGGDKYQPARIDVGLSAKPEDDDDPIAVRAQLQREVRQLVEETYLHQCQKNGGSEP